MPRPHCEALVIWSGPFLLRANCKDEQPEPYQHECAGSCSRAGKAALARKQSLRPEAACAGDAAALALIPEQAIAL